MQAALPRIIQLFLKDINGKFNLVLEGHTTLEQMIRNHQTETRQDKQELQSLIKISHDTLNEKIDSVATRLDEKINYAVEQLSGEIQAVGEKVDGHEQRITQLERKAA